jgi:hypothetical protein
MTAGLRISNSHVRKSDYDSITITCDGQDYTLTTPKYFEPEEDSVCQLLAVEIDFDNNCFHIHGYPQVALSPNMPSAERLSLNPLPAFGTHTSIHILSDPTGSSSMMSFETLLLQL